MRREVLLISLGALAGAIAAHEPAVVAAQFTEDALFQGFDPQPGFGRAAVDAYYAKQPVGLTADYELLSTREPADGVALGYARVLFHRPERDVPVFMTVVAERGAAGSDSPGQWLLSHYHVSKVIAG